MKHTPPMNSRIFSPLWSAVAGLPLVCGCAGGAWLERPLAAELTSETPTHSYPTAVRSDEGAIARRAISDDDASLGTAPNADETKLTVSTSENASPTSIRQQRIERQQSLVPVLAVVPPEYAPVRHSPAIPASEAGQLPVTAQLPVASQLPVTSQTPNLASPPTPVVAPGHEALALGPVDGRMWGAEWPPSLGTVPATTPASTTAAQVPATAAAAASGVVQATATAAVPAGSVPPQVDKAREELIQNLENEIRRVRETNASAEELPRLEQQLRLVYLTAGRLDDAVAAVESLDAPQQEAYKNLMFGLGVWLSPDEARRPPLRSAKVLHSLREATSDLAAGSKLELKNLVFCERVDYFGWYSEFPKKEFQPKQQVILYVEVENFAAEEKGPAGFETELQGSYEILDASGQIIASRQLQLDKEVCRNYRRDYFLAYRIYLPEQIAAGRYRLELVVEDLKARGHYQGRKLGEGTIEFSIR